MNKSPCSQGPFTSASAADVATLHGPSMTCKSPDKMPLIPNKLFARGPTASGQGPLLAAQTTRGSSYWRCRSAMVIAAVAVEDLRTKEGVVGRRRRSPWATVDPKPRLGGCLGYR